jgi:pimeloyl-ACP methyl ester carboxylesterase
MGQKEHPSNKRPPIVLVPGGIMPAALSYGPLLDVVKDEVQPVVKDLEVYTTDTPPLDYGLELEVEGIKGAADAAGLKSFHLVGYSAGGASSLAFTAKYPERLISLALIEPAWIGNEGWDAEDATDWAEMDRLIELPPEQRMSAFMRWQMCPGVEPPALPMPPGPPSPAMAKRPAGLEALVRAFKAYQLNRERFRQFRQPVYFALGSLSRLIYERGAKTLASLFPNMRVEVYKGRSHLDPPHRTEPERFARALRGLWARAEATIGGHPSAA